MSKQLKEGQIQGIRQHLEKKYKVLVELKKQIESTKARKSFTEEELTDRLKKIIHGQFINEILKFEIIKLEKIKSELRPIAEALSIDSKKFKIKLPLVVYK